MLTPNIGLQGETGTRTI